MAGGIAGAILFPRMLLSPVLPPGEKSKNWIWMGAGADFDADAWKERFARISQAGINAVLVQVYDGRQALYDNPNPLVPVEADVLGQLIPLAHAVDLEIHAWMISMPCNIPEVIEKHPDWYAVNGNGEPSWSHPAYVDYYKFLCPCSPGARDFVRGNVRALAAYNELDGIHLDYIRLPDVIIAEALQPKYNVIQDKEYPPYDYSYSSYCREQFKELYGEDPMSFEDPSANPEWRQFRFDVITDLVNGELVPAAREAQKFISAAVFPNWESVRQQWHNWQLDAFLPMLYHNFYNADIDWIEEETRKGKDLLVGSQPIYSGLFVPSLSANELAQAIKASQRGGASGISLFNYNAMSDAHWQVIDRER